MENINELLSDIDAVLKKHKHPSFKGEFISGGVKVEYVKEASHAGFITKSERSRFDSTSKEQKPI